MQVNILDILDTMVASDVETSVAANGVRENVLACTGGALQTCVVNIAPRKHTYLHDFQHDNQYHHKETGGRKDSQALALKRIVSLQSTRGGAIEEILKSLTVEGEIIEAVLKTTFSHFLHVFVIPHYHLGPASIGARRHHTTTITKLRQITSMCSWMRQF